MLKSTLEFGFHGVLFGHGLYLQTIIFESKARSVVCCNIKGARWYIGNPAADSSRSIGGLTSAKMNLLPEFYTFCARELYFCIFLYNRDSLGQQAKVFVLHQDFVQILSFHQ